MRTSYIPKRGSKIVFNQSPDSSKALCVGCSKPVKPGFCRTGSVLKGLQFQTRNTLERTPILGSILYRDNQGDHVHLLGGQEIPTVKRVGFNRRERGFLCDECSSEYRYFQGEPLVKVDPRPGTIGETLKGSYIPTKGGAYRGRTSEIAPRGVRLTKG